MVFGNGKRKLLNLYLEMVLFDDFQIVKLKSK